MGQCFLDQVLYPYRTSEDRFPLRQVMNQPKQSGQPPALMRTIDRHHVPMLDLLLDLFFPRRSLRGDEGTLITDDERNEMRFVPMLIDRDELRKRGIRHIDCLVAAASYRAAPLLRSAIRRFKYGRSAALCDELGRRLADGVYEMLNIDPNDTPPVLCPVPLHWTRVFQRGFNQAALLASGVGQEQGWITENLLRRTRPTGHQVGRGRTDRLQALTDVFRYREGSPVPSHVILVDDLCTTGATLSECAMALKAAGVEQVDAIVLAYG